MVGTADGSKSSTFAGSIGTQTRPTKSIVVAAVLYFIANLRYDTQ